MNFFSKAKRLFATAILGSSLAIAGATAANAAVSYEFLIHNNVAVYSLALESANCTDGVSISAPSSIASGQVIQILGSSSTASSTLCTVRYTITAGSSTYGCAFVLSVTTIPGFVTAQRTYSVGTSPSCLVVDQYTPVGHTGGYFRFAP